MSIKFKILEIFESRIKSILENETFTDWLLNLSISLPPVAWMIYMLTCKASIEASNSHVIQIYIYIYYTLNNKTSVLQTRHSGTLNKKIFPFSIFLNFSTKWWSRTRTLKTSQSCIRISQRIETNNDFLIRIDRKQTFAGFQVPPFLYTRHLPYTTYTKISRDWEQIERRIALYPIHRTNSDWEKV